MRPDAGTFPGRRFVVRKFRANYRRRSAKPADARDARRPAKSCGLKRHLSAVNLIDETRLKLQVSWLLSSRLQLAVNPKWITSQIQDGINVGHSIFNLIIDTEWESLRLVLSLAGGISIGPASRSSLHRFAHAPSFQPKCLDANPATVSRPRSDTASPKAAPSLAAVQPLTSSQFVLIRSYNDTTISRFVVQALRSLESTLRPHAPCWRWRFFGRAFDWM